MRNRWRALFAGALLNLIGLAWLADSFHVSLREWPTVETLGMLGAAIVGFACTTTRSARRWPAVVALLAMAPMLALIADLGAAVGEVLSLPGVALMLIGALLAFTAALYLLAARPPEPTPALPRARLT